MSLLYIDYIFYLTPYHLLHSSYFTLIRAMTIVKYAIINDLVSIRLTTD